MTTARCPACDAAVAADAPWCTLCFADLRPAPASQPMPEPVAEPVPEQLAEVPWRSPVMAGSAGMATPPMAPPVATPMAPPVAPPVAPPIAAPMAPTPPVAMTPTPLVAAPAAPVPAAPVPVQPTLDLELPTPTPAAPADGEEGEGPTWPCLTCDARVPLELTECSSCGMPFLGGTNPNVSLRLPVVGDLVDMSTGARFGVMAGGAVGVALVLVLVALILGHVF